MNTPHPLEELRDALGLTQTAFAAELEFSQGGLSDIERGVKNCGAGLALRVAGKFRRDLNRLGITVEDLLVGSRVRAA